MLHSQSPYFPFVSVRERAAVVGCVVILHAVVFATWLTQPARARLATRDMEVSVMMAAPAPAQAAIRPASVISSVKINSMPQPHVEPVVATELVEQQQNVAVAAPDEPTPVVAAGPVVEPDYKAAYLDNRLSYPLAARRMGLQGRVVLNVEVLESGVSGQLNVHQSSGYEVLDRAALESVRKWRFVPAQRGGQAYTRWFKIPIQFALKDHQA